MRYFCTYFDHNYLPQGLTMLNSLREHCHDAHVYVLCLSDKCHAALSSLAYSFVTLIKLSELELADKELANTKASRSLIEYYFTITPCLPYYLLTQHKQIDTITYLDADLMFFSSPEPVFQENVHASVIITPHRFPTRLLAASIHGVYNVSWMTFCNTPAGVQCLAWYRDACIDWCYDRVEDGKFADQKYLDVFPQKFADVHIIQHIGAGLAPWNIENYKITSPVGSVMVNDLPLVFYHAQGFKHLTGPYYASGFFAYSAPLNAQIKNFIFKPYIKKYTENVALTNNLAGHNDFSGIRSSGKTRFKRIKNYKRILHEWLKRTLIVHF